MKTRSLKKSRLVKCQFFDCNYATTQIHHMKYHIRSHTGEKPFKCRQCDYKAAVNSSITRHVKQVHLRLKPYICPYCPYKCNTNTGLKLHINNRHNNM